MKRRPISFTSALILVLFSLALDAAAAIPPERSKNCPPDPDTGWVVCGAQCFYPNSCKMIKNAAPGIYCRQAKLANGDPANVCFSGDYDRCCDPNYQW